MGALTHGQFRLSEREYLDREKKARDKSEYFNGVVIPMAGAKPAHNIIGANVIAEFHIALKGKRCTVYTSDQRVKSIAMSTYAYPDITVVRGDAQYDADDNLLNPTVIVEVLSKSTQHKDRTRKFDSYSKLGSLAQYVLISSEEERVEVFTRTDGPWAFDVRVGLEERLELQSLGIGIPLRDLYSQVEFAPPDDDGE